MVYKNECPSCKYENIYSQFCNDLKENKDIELELGELVKNIYGEELPEEV